MATMDLSANEQTMVPDNSMPNYAQNRQLNNFNHGSRVNQNFNAKSTNLISSKRPTRYVMNHNSNNRVAKSLAKNSSQSPGKNRIMTVNS